MDSKSYGKTHKILSKIVPIWVVMAMMVLPVLAQNNQRPKTNMRALASVSGLYGDMRIYQYGAHSAVLSKIISLELRGSTLENALQEIANQSRLKILPSTQIVPANKILTISLSQVTVNKALWKVLEGTGLRFEVSPNGHLVVMKKDEMELQAAQETVRGQVTDAGTGESLPGVNILVKGTTTGTSTDPDGNYELSVPSLSDTLLFSFVGYQTQEIPINGRTEIDVALQSVELVGEELVVIGYGSVERRDLTGSISEIDSRSISRVPSVRVDEALRGRMAGVRITQNSGAPGSRIQIRVRGSNSILASNAPLFVVNGVPMNSGIDHLNPTDIESINVLKDASATAIYGSRGANGVVLIETKKGAGMDTHEVNISSYIGFQNVIKRYEVMNARQFAEMANRLEENRGTPTLPFPDLDAVQDVTDWQDEVFRTAPMQNHSISFSGGDETTRYYISGSYLSQEGVVIGSDMQKGGLNLNLDQDLNDWLQMSANIGLTRQEVNNIANDNLTRGTGVTAAAYASPPMLPVHEEDGTFTNVAQYGFSPNVLRNPVMLSETLNNDIQNSILSSLNTIISFTDNLELNILGSMEQSFNEGNYYSPTYNIFTPAGDASTSTTRQASYLLETMGTYTRALRQNDRLVVTGGWSYQQYESKFNSQSASGFPTDLFLNNNLGAAETTDPNSSSVSEWKLSSFLGRINYSMDDRFIFTFTARADGSSRFGSENKWGFFPSGAFAWRLTEEDFISNLDLFDELKARISYGRSGNTAIGPYQSLNRLSSVRATFNGEDVIGFSPAAIANPELKWETTDQLNIGLDMAFFDSRLRVTVDGYEKRTKDLLANISIAPSTGFTSIPTNLGEVQNVGLEISVGGDILQGSFSWTVQGQFSTNQNKVIDIGGRDIFGPNIQQPFANPVNIVREGEPIGMFWGLVEDGLDEEGFVQYRDLNGDGDPDRTIIGNPHPDFIYGLQQGFYYRNFSLNMFVEGVYGNDIFWASAGHLANSFNRGENQLLDVYENHWRAEDPDPNAKYPVVHPNAVPSTSDRYIEDGSYLRLRNIRLGYNLPASLMNTIGLRNLELYVSGQNLVTLTNYPGLDPEINTRGGEGDLRIGIDEMGYPSAKTYTFGINIGF